MALLKILERLATLEQSHEVLKKDYAELKIKHEHTYKSYPKQKEPSKN